MLSLFNTTFLTLENYKLFNIIFKLKNTWIRKKNQEKCKVELEEFHL